MSKLFAKQSVGRMTDKDFPLLGNLTTLISNLKKETSAKGHRLVSQSVGRTALAMEGYTETDLTEMQSAITELNSSLESFIGHADLKGKVSEASRDAALAAATIAGDVAGYRAVPVKKDQPAMENVEYINVAGDDMFYERPNKAALEAYDERENRNATTYSTAYNMMASRQNEFAEMFFPTVVVTPDQVGFNVSLRLTQVMSDIRRGVDGAATTFNKQNIIQAVIDPDIFKSDQTKVVPVVRDEALDKFVDPSLVAPTEVLVDTETVTTAPLRMGKRLGLIDISQTEALLKTGMMDITDALDASVILQKLYLKLSGTVGGATVNEVFAFKVERLPLAVWNYSVQGNYRQMSLQFSSDDLMLTKDSVTVGGQPSQLLPALLGENQVRLSAGVSGTINLETSETRVWADTVYVSRLLDDDNTALPLTAGQGKTVADAFEASTLIGYDLTAYRTNSNRRQRGQLLDTTFYNQIYTVPVRAPLSIPRPQTNGDENDASDLASLITATHIKMNNAAIDTLLEAADFLDEYIREKDTFSTAPAILGLARWLVTPHFRKVQLDVTKVVQSLTSTERFNDISQAMIGVIRDYVFNAYRDSGWQAAADALAGGNGGKPKVLIGTDPVIARYLSISGDTRLLGTDEFKCQVETTLNKRMKGKLIISFGQEGKDGVPNPMHFGNFAWRSELALVLPTYRNGANSKELTVTPSFLHIVNLPIMIVMEVIGLSEVATGKVAIPTQEVPATAP
jgi:hypothetical protein